MKKSTKIILGAYGALVGVWLAGSAYFLVNGRDEELDEGLIPSVEPLPREENAYYLFPKLHEFHQTNFNFAVANDFVNGWTNSPAVLAEVSELVDAHSNLFACARQIVRCRGYQIPADENKMMAVGPLVNHPTARLYLMKAMCEAVRGDRKAAQSTIDELIEFGRFVRRTGLVVGVLVGDGYVGMAIQHGGRSPIAAPEDCAWRSHLMEVLDAPKGPPLDLIGAVEREIGVIRQKAEELRTNDVKMASYMMWDGLDGLGWLLRNNRKNAGYEILFDRPISVDWARVDRSCVIGVLSCCLGYSRYAFKPNATLNEMSRRSRKLSDKFNAGSYDRDYAQGSGARSVRRTVLTPFRENWLADSVLWDIRSVYRRHYKALFDWRCGRLRMACENFRFAKGRYPEDLAELVPEFVDAIPDDPYDGEPIRYNSEHGYFWTPGPDGTFEGKVDFDEDGYPRWRNRNYHFVQLLDTTKSNRPPSYYQPRQHQRTKNAK